MPNFIDEQYQRFRGLLYDSVNEVLTNLTARARMDLRFGRLGLKQKSHLRKFDKRIKKAPPGYRLLVPLRSLSSGISFNLATSRDDFVVGKSNLISAQIGFMHLSSWQARIARKSIPGYIWLYSDQDKMNLHRFGIHLRKKTTSAKVPPRDIMAAIRARYPEHIIFQTIKTLFERKLKGDNRAG